MKSANCISQTGRRPTTAAPIAQPMIADSASGVSITRSGPNSSMNLSVTLNAPPNTPMSSPIRSTRSSARSSSSRAEEIAWRYVSSGIARPPESAPARDAVAQRLGLALAEHPIDCRRRIRHRRGERLLGRGVDLAGDGGSYCLDIDSELPPPPPLTPRGVALAPFLNLLLGHVLHVVVGGVSVHPHRHRFDQGRPAARHRARPSLECRLENSLGVVAVDSDPDEPVRGGALHRVHGELLVQRGRVRILVVLEHEHDRELLHSGPVHRLVEVAP